jgi:hypothetical protein
MGIFAEPAASGTPRGRFEAKRELTVALQTPDAPVLV